MRRNNLLIAATAAALAFASSVSAADGKSIYSSNCASCHGGNGQGTPGLAPALKGSAFVTGSKVEDVIATVKDGRDGDRKKYKNLPIAMPAWGKQLSDADIKAVVDYLRGDLQKK